VITKSGITMLATGDDEGRIRSFYRGAVAEFGKKIVISYDVIAAVLDTAIGQVVMKKKCWCV
jgi:hypothetical protein